eukprot:TRINITY_DN27051_c0_g1_i1.p2 TRINITY_DN27051_c0_g1~~TRINITY_DN27051_c0_g1_i1.p2  ORF type:complete len:104 (+),score=2.79 TRINITY_DN27051_c0_g1_i1:108-419(+)
MWSTPLLLGFAATVLAGPETYVVYQDQRDGYNTYFGVLDLATCRIRDALPAQFDIWNGVVGGYFFPVLVDSKRNMTYFVRESNPGHPHQSWTPRPLHQNGINQ